MIVFHSLSLHILRKHCDNVQSINSTIANNSNIFVVPASQATNNLEGDHSLVVPLNPHSTAADFTAGTLLCTAYQLIYK